MNNTAGGVQVVAGSGLIRLSVKEAGKVITGLTVGVILAGLLFIIAMFSCIVVKVKISRQAKAAKNDFKML